jgi:pimeloyl-ACP methyl ester carboxylesterase
MTSRIVPLVSGAEARLRNEGGGAAVVLVNGGSAKPAPGTWSATSELLAEQLAPKLPQLTFLEVRYRLKTWNGLPACIADAAAALKLAREQGVERVLMIGFSMGGAVSIGVADDPLVEGVLGLAPWLPDRLPVRTLAGKRIDVVHGSWDRYIPGIPGVTPASSRRGFDRAIAAGAEGAYTIIDRGLHGAALRGWTGGLLRLPRWRAWVAETAVALDRFVTMESLRVRGGRSAA